MPSTFTDNNINSKLKDKRKLSAFIDNIFFAEVKKPCNLQYVFCTDDFVLKLNKQFLQHDTFTDIVTFDLSKSPKKIIGEIYISIDRIKENAILFETDYNTELHRVIFHGALHLCGFKDKTKMQKEEMKAMENKYLTLWGN